MTANTALLNIVLHALDELKAKDVSSLDVKELTSIADNMVIASGTSARHVKALADNVAEQAKENGYRPIGVEGGEGADWVLVDLGDVIVHVMQQSTREYYDLERLWRKPDHHPDRKES
ncbi:MAG: ribosome silencing factor [Gammaproteobacteria bacterium]|jgi:ribosome-associated protein|nr:ribosome silencing factor [Gammaproteobacteria bacterium]MBQ0774571.1 ribosome silencing factor [Gammaproteobacteria bacterium]|tara:strand:- start:22945 stop:23298 length:354 start_codon:yes stop_codon:yes gene_type:complete